MPQVAPVEGPLPEATAELTQTSLTTTTLEGTMAATTPAPDDMITQLLLLAEVTPCYTLSVNSGMRRLIIRHFKCLPPCLICVLSSNAAAAGGRVRGPV